MSFGRDSWPSILSIHPHFTKAEIEAYLPRAIHSNRVAGRLVALPWFTDGGVLYYRTDLLAKYEQALPTTWMELGATAKYVMDSERSMGARDLWGFVYEGRPYEGLTCHALGWVASFGGGTIVATDGQVSINNPEAIKSMGLFPRGPERLLPREC